MSAETARHSFYVVPVATFGNLRTDWRVVVATDAADARERVEADIAGQDHLFVSDIGLVRWIGAAHREDVEAAADRAALQIGERIDVSIFGVRHQMTLDHVGHTLDNGHTAMLMEVPSDVAARRKMARRAIERRDG